MTLARSLPEGNDAAEGALARLARLRTQAVASAPAETARRRANSAPSPLGGARRSATQDLPAWGDSAPAAARIEPWRLAVLGTLAAILLIVGFGVTQRLAQSRATPHASAALGVALAAQPVATSGAPAQTAVAAPALMPPPAAVTPSAQLSAIKQALDGSGAAGSTNAAADSATNAATTSAATDAAAPLSDTSAPAVAAPPAAAQPSTGWGAPPGQQAAVGNDAWTTPPAGYIDQQGGTVGPVVGAAPLPGAAIVWPVVGPMTSCFCPYHPLGIDIGVPLNTPVRAMAAGRVTFAGGDACCSYGYYVDIDHGNGIMTRYGHLSYIPAIPLGTAVRPGDIIGMSGTTGFSTGPHLHFEVRLNGVPVNPMDVLP